MFDQRIAQPLIIRLFCREGDLEFSPVAVDAEGPGEVGRSVPSGYD